MKSVFSKDELRIVYGALANAYGYPMGPDIESEIGCTREVLKDLIAKIKDKNGFEFVGHEKQIVTNCLRVCLQYIDAWEFSTVMGFDKKEMLALYRELDPNTQLVSGLCSKCGSQDTYSEKHEAFYCKSCNAWRDENCGRDSCDWCNGRPQFPAEI